MIHISIEVLGFEELRHSNLLIHLNVASASAEPMLYRNHIAWALAVVRQQLHDFEV